MYKKSMKNKFSSYRIYFGLVKEVASLPARFQRLLIDASIDDVFCIVSYELPVAHIDCATGIEAIELLADTGSGLVSDFYRDYCENITAEDNVPCAMMNAIIGENNDVSLGDFLALEIYSAVIWETSPVNDDNI